MRAKVYIAGLLLLVNFACHCQTWQWISHISRGKYASEDPYTSLKTDGNGNLYFIKYGNDSLFDSGDDLIPTSSKGELVKMNSLGKVDWSIPIVTGGQSKMHLVNNSDIYVLLPSFYQGDSLVINGLNYAESYGVFAYCLIRFNTNGQFVSCNWVVKNISRINEFTIDPISNLLYISSVSKSTSLTDSVLILHDRTINKVNFNQNNWSPFAACINLSNYTTQWIDTFGVLPFQFYTNYPTGYPDFSPKIVCTTNGFIIVTADTIGTTITLRNKQNQKIKSDIITNFWLTDIKTNRQGNIYIAGRAKNQCLITSSQISIAVSDTDSSGFHPYRYCVMAYDPLLNFLWTKSTSTNYSFINEYGGQLKLDFLSDGRIVVLGSMSKIKSLSWEGYTIPFDSIANIFIGILNSNGFALSFEIPSISESKKYSIETYFASLAVDLCDNIHILFNGFSTDYSSQKKIKPILHFQNHIVPLSLNSVQVFIAKLNVNNLRFSYYNACYVDSLVAFDDSNNYSDYRWMIKNQIFYGKKLVKTGLQPGKYAVTLSCYKNGTCYLSYYDTIVVFNKNIPSAGFYTDSIHCEHSTINFIDASLSDSFNGKYSWNWHFGDGNETTIESRSIKDGSVDYIYRYPGLFQVKLVFSNGFCADTFEFPFRISVLPAARPGFVSNVKSGCIPMPIQLINNYMDSVGEEKYVIYNQLGAVDSIVNAGSVVKGGNYVFNDTGTFKIIQILTSTNGCTTSDTESVKVFAGLNTSESAILHNYTWLDDKTRQLSWQAIPFASRYIITENNVKYITPDTVLIFEPSGNSQFVAQVIAIDTCGNVSHKLKAGLINLVANNYSNNQSAILRFSPFEGWFGKVESYYVEKYNFLTNKFETIAKQPDTNAYIDDKFLPRETLENLDSLSQMQCYRIAAENEQHNVISYSNIVCVPYQPLIFIPNAFTPNADGLNDKFEPLCFGISAWSLDVYNRWGEIVFSGNEKTGGWDGTIHQNRVKRKSDLIKANSELYLYVLKYKGKRGPDYFENETVNGHVVVIWK